MANTILITGANRGLGLEFSAHYLALGWRVLACCRQPKAALDLNKLKIKYASQLEIYSLDITQEPQINSLANNLKNVSIDILLNNAAIYGPSQMRLGQISQQPWLEIFATNSIGPLLLAQALLKNVAMSDRRIIANISTSMASIADNTTGDAYYYRASKTALNATMKSLALDLMPQNICVVLLNPGWVKTNMGGPHAPLTTVESVNMLAEILDKLSIQFTGCFFDNDGSLMSW